MERFVRSSSPSGSPRWTRLPLVVAATALVLGVAALFLAGGALGSATGQLEPDSTPGPRWGHVFVYDPARRTTLLFGGARERGSYLRDTWTWDGQSWHEHRVPGPEARGFAAAAFHTARGTIIMHGGRGQDGITYSDTWEWDGSEWRRLEAAGPFASDHHRMVYVAHSGQLLGFGGWDGADVSGETWAWDDGWNPESSEGPPPRAAFGIAYDIRAERVVLYGGLWIDGQYADVWTWDGRAWSQVGGPYDNSSLDHHAMVYDASRQQLVLFGGKNYRYRPQQRTLTISEGHVVPLAEDGPSPRHSIGMTHDSHTGRVLLYGGKFYRGEEHVPLGDLWSWEGDLWRELEHAPTESTGSQR